MTLTPHTESSNTTASENSLNSPVLAAHFGTPSFESITESIKKQLELYCKPGFESDIPTFLAIHEAKIEKLNVRFELAIEGIHDESGEQIAALQQERAALIATAETGVALANLRADGAGRAGITKIMEGISIA